MNEEINEENIDPKTVRILDARKGLFKRESIKIDYYKLDSNIYQSK